MIFWLKMKTKHADLKNTETFSQQLQYLPKNYKTLLIFNGSSHFFVFSWVFYVLSIEMSVRECIFRSNNFSVSFWFKRLKMARTDISFSQRSHSAHTSYVAVEWTLWRGFWGFQDSVFRILSFTFREFILFCWVLSDICSSKRLVSFVSRLWKLVVANHLVNECATGPLVLDAMISFEYWDSKLKNILHL